MQHDGSVTDAERYSNKTSRTRGTCGLLPSLCLQWLAVKESLYYLTNSATWLTSKVHFNKMDTLLTGWLASIKLSHDQCAFKVTVKRTNVGLITLILQIKAVHSSTTKPESTLKTKRSLLYSTLGRQSSDWSTAGTVLQKQELPPTSATFRALSLSS